LAVILAALYPVTYLFHFVPLADEAALRATLQIFIGVGIVSSVGILTVQQAGRIVDTRQLNLRWTVAISLSAVVVLLGNVALATAFYSRLPGPYLVSSPRSVDGQETAFGYWVRANLPANTRIVGDRSLDLSIAAYGFGYPINSSSSKVTAWPIYFDPTLGARARNVLNEDDVSLVAVDNRMVQSLPYDGVYVQAGEPVSVRPLPVTAVNKFDRTAGVYRVYDSPDVMLYLIGNRAR